MDWLLAGYWPWWACAIVFGVFVVGVWLIEQRLFGVSGHYARVLDGDRPEDRALRELERDPNALEDALLRATLEEFGPEAVEAFEQEMARDDAATEAVAQPRAPLSLSVSAVFLGMLVVGGALGALLSGTWKARLDLGPLHQMLTGGGVLSLLVLFAGGILVGFGTRMAGGCTSGHGLSGCSRLQPGSLAATASFFGTAVAISFLLEALVR